MDISKTFPHSNLRINMSTTTLCFDFGNTRLKCGVFTDGKFVEELVLVDDSDATIRALLAQFHPTRSILSSVIHHNPGLEEMLRTETRFHKLDHTSKVPISTPVGKPDTIGADRLALTVAAVTLFP